jgi:hypothetical protein
MLQNNIITIVASVSSLAAFYFMFKQIDYRTNFVSKMSGLKLIFFMFVLLLLPAWLIVLRPESFQIISITLGLLPIGLYLVWANLKSADKQARKQPKEMAINEKNYKETVNKDKSYTKVFKRNKK